MIVIFYLWRNTNLCSNLFPIARRLSLSRAERVVTLNYIVRSYCVVMLRAIASANATGYGDRKTKFAFAFFKKNWGGEKMEKTQRKILVLRVRYDSLIT